MTKKTGAEYRHEANLRAKKFRDEQIRRGYKAITIFASEEFRSELKKVMSEKGVNKQDALEHIFNGYKNNVINNDTNNKKWPNQQHEIFNQKEHEAGSAEHVARLDEFILSRHKKGGKGGKMTLKQIATELTSAGIKTVTGKSVWNSGSVDAAFKTAQKRLQP